MKVLGRSTVLLVAVLLGAGAGLASADVSWEDYMEGSNSRPPPVRAASDSGTASEDWTSSAPPKTLDPGPATRSRRAKVARHGKARAKGKARHRAARHARRR